MYPWNRQKIRQPKHGVSATCNFAELAKPLPSPPPGMMWIQDVASKEWSLVPVATATAEAISVDNSAAAEVPTNSGDIVCAVPISIQSATPLLNRSNDNETNTSGVLYHDVSETDTFQGICLRYKITPTELRRANNMMGTNLKLAPSKLIIPTNEKNLKRNVHEPTKEEKIASLIAEVSRVTKLSYTEARAYLELADWDLGCAIGNVKDGF